MKFPEKGDQTVYGPFDKVGNGLPAQFDIFHLLSEPSAIALGTQGLSPVSGEHHPILDLIALFLQFLKETVQAGKMFVAVPDQLPLLLAEIEPGFVNGKIKGV